MIAKLSFNEGTIDTVQASFEIATINGLNVRLQN